MEKDLEKILRYYGEHNQIEKTKEELEELIEALDENNFAHIVEEFADVMVMLSQIAIIYAIDTDILEDMMKYKIQRTLLRMKGIELNEKDNNDDSAETNNQEE